MELSATVFEPSFLLSKRAIVTVVMSILVVRPLKPRPCYSDREGGENAANSEMEDLG